MSAEDLYTRHPYGCLFCGENRGRHGWFGWCRSPDHRWVAPGERLILARMRARRSDPNRWIPSNDRRDRYRKWTTK